eukprot:g10119.t1
MVQRTCWAGVPRRYFWIVAAFLVLTTTALAWLLHVNLNAELKLPEEFRKREDDEDCMRSGKNEVLS